MAGCRARSRQVLDTQVLLALPRNLGRYGAMSAERQRAVTLVLEKSGTIDGVEPGIGETSAPQAIIADMVRRIVERFSPDKVILFGSYARGEGCPHSDVDLLVLFPEVDNPRQRAAELYRTLSGSGLPKDIVVSTTARFERYKNVVNTIYWPAAREGKVLYERAA